MALARFAAADRLGGLVEEWLDERASTVPITAPTTTTVADTSRITARREKAPVRLRALIAREPLSDPSETSRGPSRPSRCGEYHPLSARIRCRPRVRASSRAAVNRLSWVARRIRIRSAVSEAMSPASTFSKSPSARTSSTPRFAFCSTQSCSSAHPSGRLPERLARAPGMLKARPASMKSLAGHRHHATRSGRPANRLGRRARRPVFGCERRACLGGSGYASRPS
jgi:hypothetical protein